MSFGEYVHLDVEEILHETDKAFRIKLKSGEETWMPKSQVSDADNYNVGDKNLTLSVTEWIASQKGLS